MIEVKIIRHIERKLQTTGYLTVRVLDFTCCTIERAWKENKRMISCIPEGEYICKYNLMQRINKHHYQVMGVKARDGIFIHAANYSSELHGCIALGSAFKDINKDGMCDVAESKKTIKAFEDLFLNANKLHDDFKLIIS